MKITLFMSMCAALCLSLSAFTVNADTANQVKPSKVLEMGLYSAVDVNTGTIHAKLTFQADGTVNFKVQTPDFQMPEPGCDGTYEVVDNKLSATLKCPVETLPEVSVNIDITYVTAQALRSQVGALVAVVIDAFGEEPTMFRLKIIEPLK